MDDGLPREAARVAVRERPHDAECLGVLGQVLGARAVERPPHSPRRLGRVREPKIDRHNVDVGERRAAVDEEVRPAIGVVAARQVGADLGREICATVIVIVGTTMMFMLL